MKPSKGINMYQELFLLTLSLERWTQYGWVHLERYFDPTILFMDSLEQATIMQKVTTLKVFILLNIKSSVSMRVFLSTTSVIEVNYLQLF